MKGQVNEPDRRVIRKVQPQDSRRNNLLQVVDMIAGAVARSFTDKEDAALYRKVIKAHERFVQFWPK